MLQVIYEVASDYRDSMNEDYNKASGLFDAYLGSQPEVSLGIILGEIPQLIPFAIVNVSLFAMEKLHLATRN